ncbi:hypothetical protein ABIF16_005384 [Bradyrhizobium elkanii]
MAFPHDTFLNARWSEAQSAAMPRSPGVVPGSALGVASVVSVIASCLAR